MTTLSKEEYLKRYLDPVKSGDYKKKKKTREKTKQTRGMRIVDDDVSWSKMAPKEDDIPDELLLREEMPKIEEIDERTQEEKALDLYRKGDKWKIVDAGKDGKTTQESNRSSARHDSDSDMDVPRRRHDSSSESGEQTKHNKRASNQGSGSDLDVVRRPRKRHDSSSDSMSGDCSVTKTREKSSRDSHKSRRTKTSSVRSSSRHHSRSKSPNLSRTNERNHSHSMSKSKIKRQESSDSDLELPRVSSRKHSNHHRKDGSGGYKDPNYFSSSKSKTLMRRHDSDSDLELPRTHPHQEVFERNKSKVRRRQSSDSDLDLPRKQTKEIKHRISSRKNSDSDLDLPRKNATHDNKKASSGAVGGLTSRQELKRELQHKKKMESDMDSLARESRNEATVFRVKGGKKRDLQQEKMEKDAEDREKEKKLKKYNQWGKGVTQTEMKDYALENLIHEANKPLARYADDADLDAFQRSQMRDGDPMAEYLAKKRRKEAGNVPTMPKYRGPAPAPNRYGIPPGYRWDGVDRSNGFEKKYFNSKSESGALKQEAYKWSVEDM